MIKKFKTRAAARDPPAPPQASLQNLALHVEELGGSLGSAVPNLPEEEAQLRQVGAAGQKVHRVSGFVVVLPVTVPQELVKVFSRDPNLGEARRHAGLAAHEHGAAVVDVADDSLLYPREPASAHPVGAEVRVEAADLEVFLGNPPGVLEGHPGDEIRDEDGEQVVEVEGPQGPLAVPGCHAIDAFVWRRAFRVRYELRPSRQPQKVFPRREVGTRIPLHHPHPFFQASVKSYHTQ